MLCVALHLDGRIIPLPALRPGGRPASLSEQTADGLQLVVVACADDDQGGLVAVSRQGVQAEVGAWRLITGTDFVVERRLGPGETYERPLQTRHGLGTLRVSHRPTGEGEG
jgi:hypothetical protein